MKLNSLFLLEFSKQLCQLSKVSALRTKRKFTQGILSINMAEIKFCSVCGLKVAESDQFCGSCGTKRINIEKDDRIEIAATKKSIKDFLQEKRKDRQKFNLPRKSLGCHKIRSDAKPSHKIVDTSVIIEVGIMDMSKENLEPVRGSRLPVKV